MEPFEQFSIYLIPLTRGTVNGDACTRMSGENNVFNHNVHHKVVDGTGFIIVSFPCTLKCLKVFALAIKFIVLLKRRGFCRKKGSVMNLFNERMSFV